MSAEELQALLEAHRPYGLDCKCGVPINSDAWWARHVLDEIARFHYPQRPAVGGVLGVREGESDE